MIRQGDWTLWTLSADVTGSPPILEATCTTCDDSSGAAEETKQPEVWCLSHAHQTGHTGFRMITTSFLQRVHGKRGLFRDGCTGPKGDA
ncbi:DUF7848 domain-containing protein [Streptomyces asiaticus]|uniref:DUF7848 domain-containing protein n=1 Tax=Streptomyces asiaticus TaxID=114695 RepID=UPI003F673B7C